MPDSGLPPEPRKPTLADQHWRALLRRKPKDDVQHDMLEAVEKNDSWRFSMLVQLDMDWAHQDQLLRRTIELGRDAMFREIVAKDSSWQQSSNLTQLAGYAAEAGHLDFVKLFVEQYKADIHYYNDEMLRAASRNGHEAVVEYLLSKGADHSAWNNTSLKEAAENGHLGVVKKLVEAGAEVKTTGWNSDPLEAAARGGHAAVVEYLLDKGADATNSNYDAFMTACRYGHKEVVDAFLKHGVKADVRESEGLVSACENKAFDTAKLLIANGADINAQSGRALRLTAYRGETDAVKFLLEQNADPNARQQNDTALTEAVRAGQKGIVRLLLKAGADQSLMNWEAWRVARRNHDRDMQHILVDGERAARERAQETKLAEFRAAFRPPYSFEELREKKGASGETGLVLAARSGHFAELLQQAKGGNLLPSDLFHPDDRLDSVLTILHRNKTLQQFFEPAFWTDRTGQVVDAYENIPQAMRTRVKLDGITAQLNRNAMMQKMKGGGGSNGVKPPKIGKPPKITGH